MIERGFKLDETKMAFDTSIFHDNRFFNDWTPTTEDLKLVCDRIKSKIELKPGLYLDKDKFLNYYDKIFTN